MITNSPQRFDTGNYVLVVDIPEAWDASESKEDREAYVGHVGILEEEPDVDGQVMVKFPTLSREVVTENHTGRVFEIHCLLVVSIPSSVIPTPPIH